jgi:adenosylhomocysteine nucleosidase
MSTWLLIAAEPQEFAGILKRAGSVARLDWPGVAFVREIAWRGRRWRLAANGPGPRLAARAVEVRRQADLILSVGFCGALDPALRIGDIVVSGEFPEGGNSSFVRARVLSLDRVVVTEQEKRTLRETTGASVVEMESAVVEAKAAEWRVPFCCVRAVSDMAHEDMPLDFNQYRDSEGRFARARIAGAAITRPAAIPKLVRLNRNCRRAAESLGEFFANCQL